MKYLGFQISPGSLKVGNALVKGYVDVGLVSTPSRKTCVESFHVHNSRAATLACKGCFCNVSGHCT